MEMHATLDTSGVEFLKPGIARRILQEEVGKGMTMLVEPIADRARADVRVDTGILRGSIFTEVKPGHGDTLITGLVATGKQAPYAEDVERGTKPHRITDMDGLKGWARRKLGNERLAYAVAHNIAKRGTQPQPYLLPAALAVEPQVDGVMEAAVNRAVQRM